MILSDRTITLRHILGESFVQPFPAAGPQPCSIDLTLGTRIGILGMPRTPEGLSRGAVDPARSVLPEVTYKAIPPDQHYPLEPGEFVLAETAEVIVIPADKVGFIWNRSSLARIGLSIHPNACLFDPGWRGVGTLELFNLSRNRILLRPGMAAGQLVVSALTSVAERPYGSDGLGSRYQGAEGVEGAKI